MTPSHVPAALGIGLMLGLGVFMFAIAGGVRAMVRSTHDFVIAGRRIGLGSVKLIYGLQTVVAETRQEAQDKYERVKALIPADGALPRSPSARPPRSTPRAWACRYW